MNATHEVEATLAIIVSERLRFGMSYMRVGAGNALNTVSAAQNHAIFFNLK